MTCKDTPLPSARSHGGVAVAAGKTVAVRGGGRWMDGWMERGMQHNTRKKNTKRNRKINKREAMKHVHTQVVRGDGC